MALNSLELTLEETQEAAVDDLVRRTAVWAKKVSLAPGELLDLLREALAAPAPLNPEDEALLRKHGIDDEQYRAVSLNDGGKAYRALMARRAKRAKKGATA